jgi:hypothetical protein
MDASTNGPFDNFGLDNMASPAEEFLDQESTDQNFM